jgi:dihydropyrimidinase
LITSSPSGEVIKERNRRGQPVFTETCPQYLLLTEDEMKRWGPMAKIGPPMRTPRENEGLWQGVRQGVIPIVASDHSAHDPKLKQPGWQNIFNDPSGAPIPFGAPSAETLVPLMYSEGVVKRGLPVWWMARALAENPARMFGLYPRKGVIAPGADADFTIINPSVSVTLKGAELHSKTGFTPYEGWKLQGKPVTTIIRGQTVLKDGALQQPDGFGQYLPAGEPLPPVYGPVVPPA